MHAQPGLQWGLAYEFLVVLTNATSIAVIPTLGIGGPMAVLALLFPSVFGGALLVFRKWLALLTVAGINSTLLTIHLWFGRSLNADWLSSGPDLWLVMTLVTLAGTLWAWRRHLAIPNAGEVSTETPLRSEHILLWLGAIGFAITLFALAQDDLSNNDASWKTLVVFLSGFALGALYLAGRAILVKSGLRLKTSLPTEGVMLWAMMVAAICLSATWPARPIGLAGEITAGQTGLVRQEWQRVFPISGFIVSNCMVVGDRVYVAAAHKQGAEVFGAVYCLDAVTGQENWKFDNGGDMTQVYSSPCLWNGRLFIGEGFHEDRGCRLFCIDAKTGKRIWQFSTASHTESSPCVVNRKVYFGAGDDGVYCLRADSDQPKLLWNFPGKTADTTPNVWGKDDKAKMKRRLKLHVDASPVVVGNRLYIGSGIDRDNTSCDPAVFCLDAQSGKKIWLLPLLSQELPVWGSPVVHESQVFFGIGNGDMLNNGPNPRGALLCLESKTGKELWRYRVPNGVIRKPAVDDRHVYFGCRDGQCYCLGRKTGQLVWKHKLGSPIVASPTLLHCRDCGTNRLIVVGSEGQVRSLDPDSGAMLWKLDYDRSTFLASSPAVAIIPTANGPRRRIFFGAGLARDAFASVICLEEK